MAPRTKIMTANSHVINVIGSSNNSHLSTTARKHWIKHSGRAWPAQCCAHGCINPAKHGGHVQLSDEDASVFWIVPVCHNPHNPPRSDMCFRINAETKAVEDDTYEFASSSEKSIFDQAMAVAVDMFTLPGFSYLFKTARAVFR